MLETTVELVDPNDEETSLMRFNLKGSCGFSPQEVVNLIRNQKEDEIWVEVSREWEGRDGVLSTTTAKVRKKDLAELVQKHYHRS